MITFDLPYPPSVNGYYKLILRGRFPSRMVSDKGKAYRAKVEAMLACMGVEPMEGRLKLTVDAFPPDRRQRDLDNINKCLFDSLQHGGAFRNDSQVKQLVMQMHEPIKGGKVTIRLEQITEQLFRSDHGQGSLDNKKKRQTT